MRYMIEYAPAKTGGYPNSKLRMLQNYLSGNEHISSLHLGRKYARIFVRGHYLFLGAHNFPLGKLFASHCYLDGIRFSNKYLRQ